MAKSSIAYVLWAVCFTILISGNPTSVSADSGGRIIRFQIEDPNRVQAQYALVQNGKVFLKQAGGDPNLDLLFSAETRTLFIIDHRMQGYYKIDQDVVSKAVSMVESLSAIAVSQQGVISDLLNTFGLAEEQQDIEIRETDKTLSAAGIACKLIRQYSNGKFETEVCIASAEDLSVLGGHYATLETFYMFGDHLLNHAGSVLSSMGMTIPTVSRLTDNGLPIMIYTTQGQIKVKLTEIIDQKSSQGYFLLPTDYRQIQIPFIG